jgi:hypothetical protein
MDRCPALLLISSLGCRGSIALQDRYFQRIDITNIPAMLQRKMMHSSKGGYMFAIAIAFLVGTLALWLLGTIEG